MFSFFSYKAYPWDHVDSLLRQKLQNADELNKRARNSTTEQKIKYI